MYILQKFEVYDNFRTEYKQKCLTMNIKVVRLLYDSNAQNYCPYLIFQIGWEGNSVWIHN